ncbi:uncharacterized protein LOC130645672 isoform X1 [Hydractinia symbiolongicarpus]|uniref:uncharacterized protein LOC130645672 isoform X1 n=1 Tax=Hydractinia symbiolongicarpus TaxID=13093 RepID=UPI00254ABEF1|nr:uncharacterized protein LOC130645672 isoform X1 [Hydractinia symbiolongicarpus]
MLKKNGVIRGCTLLEDWFVKSPPLHKLKSTWRKRYFVLAKSESLQSFKKSMPSFFLIYWTGKREKAKGTRPIRIIPLDQSCQVKLTNHPLNKEKYPYVVSVASTEREYYLCADNDTTRILWHDTMVQVVKAAQEADYPMFLNMPIYEEIPCAMKTFHDDTDSNSASSIESRRSSEASFSSNDDLLQHRQKAATLFNDPNTLLTSRYLMSRHSLPCDDLAYHEGFPLPTSIMNPRRSLPNAHTAYPDREPASSTSFDTSMSSLTDTYIKMSPSTSYECSTTENDSLTQLDQSDSRQQNLRTLSLDSATLCKSAMVKHQTRSSSLVTKPETWLIGHNSKFRPKKPARLSKIFQQESPMKNPKRNVDFERSKLTNSSNELSEASRDQCGTFYDVPNKADASKRINFQDVQIDLPQSSTVMLSGNVLKVRTDRGEFEVMIQHAEDKGVKGLEEKSANIDEVVLKKEENKKEEEEEEELTTYL